MDCIHLSFYRFVDIQQDLITLKNEIKNRCINLELKGSILISTEGINSYVAGETQNIHAFKDFIQSFPEFQNLTFKENHCTYLPYNRMLVKIKKEIISMGVPEVRPVQNPGPAIAPDELKKWYDNKKDFLILDTRNDYEVRLGRFKNAINLHLKNFRQFPKVLASLPEETQKDLKRKPVVAYCTGGIRCEKAVPLLIQQGFQNVYQLEGGIIKYFEKCGASHYEGECFVFDQRVGLKPSFEESETEQCFNCRSALTPEEQTNEDYVPGISCPYCA